MLTILGIMRYFTAIFDKNYLVQGLTVFRSLQRYYKEDEFIYYPLCMDDEAFDLIRKMAIPNLVPVHVDALNSSETLPIREKTTRGQYCWVSQPLVCRYLLDHYELDHITYLESDSLFFASPEHIFEEIGDGSVSLVPHRYSPAYDQTKTSGVFCVQFNLFRNDEPSRRVLDYWKDSCFLYDKSRPKAYPGQTSLDAWTDFDGVKVVDQLGAGLAPWNVQQYEISNRDGQVYVNDDPLVFYHYHQFSFYQDGDIDLGYYALTNQVIDEIYRPYMVELEETKKWIKQYDKGFNYIKMKAKPANPLKWLLSPSIEEGKNIARKYVRKLIGTYNVYTEL